MPADRRTPRQRSARRAGLLIAGAGALLVGVLTLTPGPAGSGRIAITCFWCDRLALQDTLLNVLLFVPFGVGLGVARLRARWWEIAAVVALTLAVEGLQLGVVRGRDPSLRDVLANTLGGIVGMAIGVRWRLLLIPHPRRAWRLVAGARLAWVGLNLVAAWLLGPAAREQAATVIAGTHVGGYADFAGKVGRWGFSPRPAAGAVPSAEPPLVRAVAVVQPGPRLDPLTPVVTALDSSGGITFMLAVQRDDAVLHFRTRGDVARLPSPRMRFPGAIKPWYRTAAPPRNLLELEAIRFGDRGVMKVVSATGGIVEGDVPVRTTQGWAFLVPGGRDIAPGFDLLSAAWCFLLLLPTGYWTAQTGHHRRSLAWTLAGIAAGSGLALGPLFFAQALPPWTDVAGSALGLGVGALLSQLAVRRRA